MEIATRALLRELDFVGIGYRRVNTADPGDILGNRGRWTVHNVNAALRHAFLSARHAFARDVSVVYLPIAQGFPALFRDLTFMAIAHAARKPVIVHLHGGALREVYESQPSPVRALLRAIVGRAALGIVLTAELRPALECLLPRSRVAVVENGVDLPELEGERPDRPSRRVEVLFLSSLYRRKGVLAFVEGFGIASKHDSALRATIAGGWPDRATRTETLELVQRLGLEAEVTFVGAVEGGQKAQLFRRADIFCFPSLIVEGQPLVILEAMAAALPVVATAYPGIAATVLDAETGLLIEEPSPKAIAEKLLHLAQRPDERARLGAAARERYEMLYTQRAFGERMINVLRPFLEPTPVRLKALGEPGPPT